MGDFLFLLLSGVTQGSVYGLVALSLSLVYGTNRIINFAQGDFVMVGAVGTGVLSGGFLLLPWPLAMLGALAVAMALGWALERAVYRPLVRRNASPLTVMIGTFAASSMMIGTAFLLAGANPVFVPPLFGLRPVSIGEITTTTQQLGIVGVFCLLMLGTWLLIHHSDFGLSLRATGINGTVAMLMGIRTHRIVRFGFVFSALVSGATGILIGPLTGGGFQMGMLLTIKGFMAAILGGLGSPFAAAAGGITIGILEALIAGYASSFYAEPILFGLVLIILLVRPTGLLGEFEAAQR